MEDCIDAGATNSSTSRAYQTGRLLVCSGKVPEPLRTREMRAGDVRMETAEVMKTLAAALAARGSSFSQVVKSTIFLTDPEDFPHVHSVYGSYFDGLAQPASSMVQVFERGEARVEIELIALI